MPNNRASLLLVEDQPDDEQLARIAIARSGVAVDIRVAHDGEEAVRILCDCDDNPLPDLVLLDYRLPLLDGFGVLARVRANPRTAGLPVVMVSTSCEREDVRRAYSVGANGYVRKASDFHVFCQDMTLMLQFWLTQNIAVPTPAHHQIAAQTIRAPL